MDIFRREPALILGAIQAAIVLAVAFGVDLTIEQTGAILAFLAALTAVVVRQSVYSPSTHEDEVAETKRTTRLKTLAQVDAQLGEQVVAPLPPVITGAGKRTGGN